MTLHSLQPTTKKTYSSGDTILNFSELGMASLELKPVTTTQGNVEFLAGYRVVEKKK